MVPQAVSVHGLAADAWRRLAVAVLLAEAGLFLYTGFVKLRNPGEFASVLSSHGLVPETLTLPVAWAVIGVELGGSLAALLWLTAGRVQARAAMILAALFGSYAFLLTLQAPPKPTPCGCGVLAVALVESWTWIASRNLALAAVTALLGRSLSVRLAPAPA
ncbi:MAG: hypothetical protein BroJett004_18460 [Planctomycetota bacterium]|nr:hypothetical protein [Phycisphaerales bacterium]GIK19682.1 MAG: hypothetical protein BroJett004_18460 [Planctomycetota bacterium]